jgi:hypothetical protein
LHARTEKVLSDLRETPIGRLIPGTAPGVKPSEEKSEKPEDASRSNLVESAKGTIEDWQHKMDERLKTMLLTPLQQLQGEVKRLSNRIEELEKKLKANNTK